MTDTTTRLVVDPELCQGHGRCVSFVPERIDFDELGYAVVQDNQMPIGADELAQVKMAIDNCPEQAVLLVKGE